MRAAAPTPPRAALVVPFIVVNESTVSILAEQRGIAGPPTLSMLGITKHYDGVAALTDVSFDVLPGETERHVYAPLLGWGRPVRLAHLYYTRTRVKSG